MLSRKDIVAHIRALTDKQLSKVCAACGHHWDGLDKQARFALPKRGVSPQLVVAVYGQRATVREIANHHAEQRRLAQWDRTRPSIAETKRDAERIMSAIKHTRPAFSGTIKDAVKKRRERLNRRHVAEPLPLETRVKRARIIVPLGMDHREEAGRDARRLYPQRKNWDSCAAVAEWWQNTHVRDISHGRYSSRCTYTRYTYEPQVGSFAFLTSYGMCYVYRGKKYRFRNPHGYRWGRDENGLRLYRVKKPSDDYHPQSTDLIGPDGTPAPLRSLTAIVRENTKVRNETAARARAETKRAKDAAQKAEREGCRVCVADSLRAGNCYAGTSSWARRHGLDTSKHYEPSKVLELANGDAHRVSLVVNVALRRHREEMQRGFCLVSEHRA